MVAIGRGGQSDTASVGMQSIAGVWTYGFSIYGAIRQMSWEKLAEAVGLYALSLAISFGGVVLGIALSDADNRLSPVRTKSSGSTFRDALTQWDGQWYLMIATEGYSYQEDAQSNVAFFPVYPMITRFLSILLEVPIDLTALALAHISRLLASYLMVQYLSDRPSMTVRDRRLAAISFAIFPTSFFGLVAYSESLFTVFVLVFLKSIRTEGHKLVPAVFVGLAGATRATGIGLLLPLLAVLIRAKINVSHRLIKTTAAAALGSSGLAAYCGFLHIKFGDCIAFAKTQKFWTYIAPVNFSDKLWSLLSAEPIWGTFVADSPAYWGRFDYVPLFFLSIHAMNAIWFVFGVTVVLLAWRKRWIDTTEFLTCAMLMGIPYVTRSYEMCMASQGRFMLPVIPVFIATGHILGGMPWYVAVVSLLFCAVQFAWFAGLWGAGFVVI